MTSGSSAGARWLVIALVAALGLTLSVSVAGAGATASRDIAMAAKKKCKKKKGVTSAKKKKCRKKRHIALPAPFVRATISWSGGNVDLNAYDTSGNHSGFAQTCPAAPCPVVNGIPNTSHSDDAFNGGSETFTDDIFVLGGTANREFSYVLCFYDAANVTFTGVTRTGQSQTIPINNAGGTAETLTPTGGPATPDPSAVC